MIYPGDRKERMVLPNWMNFRKSSKEGKEGGHFQIFNPKIYVADFGNFKHKQGFLGMKLIQQCNFRVQGMFFQHLY